MFRNRLSFATLALLLSLAALPAAAVQPAADLLPADTKGYLSIPDVDELRSKWEATQLGDMMNDPAMAAFVEDVQRQLRSKLSQTDARLGINLEDLQDVYGGEVCAAVVQPWDPVAAEQAVQEAIEKSLAAAQNADKSEAEIAELKAAAEASAREQQDRLRRDQRAMVLLVDVTGHLDQANELLVKVARELKARGGTESRVTVHDVEVVKYTIPAEEAGQPDHLVHYVIHQDQLVACDHAEVCASILAAYSSESEDCLSKTAAFTTTLAESRKAMGDIAEQIRWFVDPFGYVEVTRAYEGGKRRRGTDLLAVLGNQGFDAVQGAGGVIALATGEHEIRHHSFIYAPPLKKGNGERYRLAANMLDFPNVAALNPQDWIPSSVSSYLTFKWDMQNAFEYASTLVDEVAGDEVFEDVLKSIETDPNGPQINIRQDLIQFLAGRATVVSDYRTPIGPECERLLFAIEVSDAAAVMKTVNKAMESDPAAKRREHNGHTIWEILNDEPADVEAVHIDGFGFDFEEPELIEEPEKPIIPNSAVTVANGHLLVASHVDYVVEILEQPVDLDQLANTVDYRRVTDSLDALIDGPTAFRFFTRTDEAYRPTYELVRDGRMPEAKTMLGKLLNRLWEPDEEGALRPQHIDGSKMPEFEEVRKYLGPAGFSIRSQEEGWSIAGCLLTKE